MMSSNYHPELIGPGSFSRFVTNSRDLTFETLMEDIQ